MIRVALFLSALLLAGCAHDGGTAYPSLAPRPVERLGFAEPVRPAAVLVPDPALDAQIVQQQAGLDHIVAGFTAAAGTAERAVAGAAGRPVGSDAWLDAQAALTRLDDWQTQISALAGTIDAAASARAAQLQPAYPALDALAAHAAAEAERETGTIERLQRALPAA